MELESIETIENKIESLLKIKNKEINDLQNLINELNNKKNIIFGVKPIFSISTTPNNFITPKLDGNTEYEKTNTINSKINSEYNSKINSEYNSKINSEYSDKYIEDSSSSDSEND